MNQLRTIKRALLANTHRITLVAILLVATAFFLAPSVVLARLPDEDIRQIRNQEIRERLESAYCFEPTSSTPGANKVIIPGQSYKEVPCTSIFGTGPFREGHDFIKANGCYFIAFGASACDEFPNVGLYLFQYLQQKYPDRPNVGQGSNGQGIVTPNPPPASGGGSSTPTTTEAEEDDEEQLTEEEIAQQAQDLRDQLAKGTNNCGDSKTVFNFNCNGSGNGIEQLLLTVVRFITYGVGIILTLSIVISGIQHITAQGDTNTVRKARMRIFNAVIALLLYLFAFAILNYLVPGGLIN